MRLTPALSSALCLIIRWAQIRAYAFASTNGSVVPTNTDGGLHPSVWLDKTLVSSVSNLLPFPEESIRGRLRTLGEKTSLPEQVETLRRRLGAKLGLYKQMLHSAIAPAVERYKASVALARETARRRGAELASALIGEPGLLVGEKIDVWRDCKPRVVKVTRHIGPALLFELQAQTPTDSLLCECSLWMSHHSSDFSIASLHLSLFIPLSIRHPSIHRSPCHPPSPIPTPNLREALSFLHLAIVRTLRAARQMWPTWLRASGDAGMRPSQRLSSCGLPRLMGHCSSWLKCR